MLHLHLVYASFSKMCPKVAEEPKRGCFFGSGNAKNISHIKLMAIASLLRVISAYQSFHRNALLYL